MRILAIPALGVFAVPASEAKEVRRLGPSESPISASVEMPAVSRIVYVSGTVPDAADAAAPGGSAIFFAGDHLSYVMFWQEGAALSSHAAMKAIRRKFRNGP